MEEQRFNAKMTVGEAMRLHEDAKLVFASYHLGGCTHCSINDMESLEQVCAGYGVPLEDLLASLNNLV